MVCHWLRIGPVYSVVSVAMALFVTPDGMAMACRIVVLCHDCV
jgi:hypothetical protein